MPKQSYGEPVNFNTKTLRTIEQANIIISEYASQGFDLTLRQLYYQFVSRDLIPNKQTEYKRLGNIINDARLSGLVDWNAIVDRTRFLRGLSFWDNPQSIVFSAAHSFRVNKWENQAHRVEVWIEKDALVGVIEGVCNKYEVPFFSCRGYVSQSEMWATARRICRAYDDSLQKTTIIHLGDHDPSGIDMTRDITDRIEMFTTEEGYEEGIFDICRIALNMNQIRKYSPPPNPAKSTDSRFHSYYKKHGGKSWELDALDPKTLSGLIENEIKGRIDFAAWDKDKEFEDETKSTIESIGHNYEKIKDFLGE